MITVFASELSGCVGLNKYKPIEEMALQIWNRVDPDSYKTALNRNSLKQQQTIEEQLSELKITERIYSTIKSQNCISELHTLLLELDDDIDEETQKSLRSFVFTERGKDAEDSSINNAEKQLQTTIKDRNSRFYKKYFDDNGHEVDKNVVNGKDKESRNDLFLLGGKVDGITEEGVLVEMKNRQYRLFSTIPIYEKVQIHAYMYLTGIFECRLIQCFKDQTSSKIIKFDEDFWSSVKTKLLDFVKALKNLIKDEKAQDMLLCKNVLDIYETPNDNDDI